MTAAALIHLQWLQGPEGLEMEVFLTLVCLRSFGHLLTCCRITQVSVRGRTINHRMKLYTLESNNCPFFLLLQRKWMQVS